MVGTDENIVARALHRDAKAIETTFDGNAIITVGYERVGHRNMRGRVHIDAVRAPEQHTATNA